MAKRKPKQAAESGDAAETQDDATQPGTPASTRDNATSIKQLLATPIESVALDSIQRDPHNAMGHPDRNIDDIRKSLRRFGQVEPLLVWHGTIIHGSGRHEAMEAEGWTECEIRRCDALTESEAKALAIAMNRTAQSAEWNVEQLGDTIAELCADGWDVGDVGFDQKELDALIAGWQTPAVVTEDEPPIDRAEELREKWQTARGQLWEIVGKQTHRLLCGDAVVADDVVRVVGGAQVNIAITSPPYASQRKYDESSGFKPIHPDHYVDWWQPIQENVARHLAEDGSFFVNIKPCADGLDTSLYVLDLVIAHVRRWGWHFATEFCWERNGVPKMVTRRFKNQFEAIYQFTRGEWKMRPEAVRHASDDVPMSLGAGSGNTGWADRQGESGVIPSNRKPRRAGKTSTASLDEMQGTGVDVGDVVVNGLAYPGNRLPTFSGSHKATGHTAAYPVGLPAWFIAAYSDAGDSVFDPFVGSGSTIVAAEQCGRVGVGIEISPAYCAIILERMTNLGCECRLAAAKT